MLVPELIQRKSRIAKTIWLRLVERRALARASAIHYTSQLEADDARRTGLPLARPFVVPNGIDLPANWSTPRDENTLLFLGRINWKKGLDRAIAALPEGARLIVAGNDEENLTPRLRELAEKLGVGERVEFPGPVYGDAKWELLARATLFVLLSVSENFGSVVLEALSQETPVVLSKGVGLADDVVRAGAGIIGADGIAALLADPARRAEMGRNGRALVESRFTWPRVAAEMEKEYERCCSMTSRR
jgi:glycosyltransferase involved in cell wall biosynthesis